MAKTNNKTPMLFYLLLLLSAFLMISIAEGRKLSESGPNCDEVIGVASGDTCSGLAQLFGLSTEFFAAINPNLNCDALFVGQWLCVSGSA